MILPAIMVKGGNYTALTELARFQPLEDAGRKMFAISALRSSLPLVKPRLTER